MPAKEGKKYVINVRLMKLTGLYQLLDPNTPKLCGFNGFKIGSIIALLILVTTFVMCNISIYYVMEDFTEVVNYSMVIVATSLVIFKLYFVIRNSATLWEFISFTSVDFLSYDGHQKAIIDRARTISIAISNSFAFIWTAIIFVWMSLPIIKKGDYFNVKSTNGTYRQYQFNSLNLVIPVSAGFYNENFLWFYFIESIPLMIYSYSMMIYDCLVISIGITIAYQFKTVASSFRKLGHDNINAYHVKSKQCFPSIIHRFSMLCVEKKAIGS